MSPEQRAKYADRFRTADSIHRDSYNFGPPVIPSVKPRYTPPELPITPTPPKKKDDKKDDDKDDDKQKVSDKEIEKKFKSFLSNLPKTFSDKVKKVNLDKLDQATMDKAKLIKSGDLYYKTNDLDQAKDYLKRNNLDYRIDEDLSTKEHLVLVDNTDPTNVKIASRGTNILNTDDLQADVDILTGRQTSNSTFKIAKELGQKVKAAYPEASVEAVGFSLGGAKSIHMSNEIPGIKSTTFNPYLVHEAADTGSHTIFRTKDDLPSFMAGSLRDKGNIEINTVNSLDPDGYLQREHHSLKNFFTNRPEKYENGVEKKFRLRSPEEQAAEIEEIGGEFESEFTGDNETNEPQLFDESLNDDPSISRPSRIAWR